MTLRCKLLGHDEHPHGRTENGKGWWWRCRRCHKWTAYDATFDEVDTSLDANPNVREVQPGLFKAAYRKKGRRETEPGAHDGDC